MKWFDVDKKGLGKIVERKGKSFVVFELIQNAWDQNVTRVDVVLEPIPDVPLCRLVVADDDPEGFADISHAYTLFAESAKKDDPEKRGRFNLGEKLVLALCKNATISTTKGTVEFSDDGERHRKNKRRERGSEFSGTVSMTRAEYNTVCENIKQLIPPVETYFNGYPLSKPEPLTTFEIPLLTEISDEEGRLKKTTRKTRVDIYENHNGSDGQLYEMGIPVVETGDKYHVDIQQKVPVNLDRDNVPPSYLRTIRRETLNAVYDFLDKEDAADTWVQEALNDEDCKPEAVRKVVDLCYGEKRVAFDPSDPEANHIAVAQGYTVIPGGSFSKKQWKNVKSAEAILPAGKVTPSPKPYVEDGVPETLLPQEKWTDGMRKVEMFLQCLHRRLIGGKFAVRINTDKNVGWSANYGSGVYTISLVRCGHRFFNEFPNNMVKVIDQAIHEFAHHYESNHLSERYYEALSDLGARTTMLALKESEIFEVD